MALTPSHTPVYRLIPGGIEPGKPAGNPLDLYHPWRVVRSRSRIGRTEMHHMKNTWETTVRTAANTMLRHPDKISDGLEAELYALLEKLGTTKAGQPENTGTPDDAA